MPTVEERVANGVTWLDSHRPGWRDQISNLERLDIASGRMCVLGQTGGWNEACMIMAKEDGNHWMNRVMERGFAPCAHGLNAEWKRVIHAGRVAPDRQLTCA